MDCHLPVLNPPLMMRQGARLSVNRSMRPFFASPVLPLMMEREVMVTVVLRYGLIDEAKRDQQTKERDVVSTYTSGVTQESGHFFKESWGSGGDQVLWMQMRWIILNSSF